MSDTIITVENLSKRYRLGVIGATTLKESVERGWHRLRGRDWRHHMGVVGSHSPQRTQGTQRGVEDGENSPQRTQRETVDGGELRVGSGESNPNLKPCSNEERNTKNQEHLPNQEPSTKHEAHNANTTELWALKDVSFEVKRGEVLGVIGRNGAGKSTLLKILTRITEPTSGRAVMRGRVASLLEVGTGFHPELTGRENIYLNGAILGMKRAEITGKFDEIVGFAEVEKFIDTPVKRYSSGMYVRLAFAVAAHLEPEILLVDEVLAVGDAAFQKRCLGKMQDVAAHGRTVLFVSHNMGAIQMLCQKCIVLADGGCDFVGCTGQGIAQYLGDNRRIAQTEVDSYRRQQEFNKSIEFVELGFSNNVSSFRLETPIAFYVKVFAHQSLSSFRISVTVFSGTGIPVGSSFSMEDLSLAENSSEILNISLPDHRLAAGYYYFSISVGTGTHKTVKREFDTLHECLRFHVLPEYGEGETMSKWSASWGSVVFPSLVVNRGI